MAISKMTRCSIHLVGLRPLMFDRYAGDNVTELRVEDKLYLGGKTGRGLVLPAENVMSYLCAINTQSAPKLVFPAKVYKSVAQAFSAVISVEDEEIPILRKGKPIEFNGFDDNGRDDKAGIQIKRSVARLPKGIPNPKVRPVVMMPWEVKFNLLVMPHPVITEEILRATFERGGIVCGFGTFRPTYGKFAVEKMTFAEF